MEDPVVPLERNLYGHPLAGLLWERQFEKVLLKHGWEKIPNWECLFVHREKGLFLSVYVDDIKLAGKKHNIDPMWKVLNKEVDLGEPTSFLDHVYLGCTQVARRRSPCGDSQVKGTVGAEVSGLVSRVSRSQFPGTLETADGVFASSIFRALCQRFAETCPFLIHLLAGGGWKKRTSSRILRCTLLH